MYGVTWCKDCQRNVIPVKEFNVRKSILFLYIFYLPVYWREKPHCPYCGGKNFGSAKAD